jgi:hypothetical protein
MTDFVLIASTMTSWFLMMIRPSADRPFEAWPRTAQDQLKMGRRALDLDDLWAELGPEVQ